MRVQFCLIFNDISSFTDIYIDGITKCMNVLDLLINFIVFYPTFEQERLMILQVRWDIFGIFRLAEMAKAAGNGDLDVGPAENIEMMEGEPRIRPQV